MSNWSITLVGYQFSMSKMVSIEKQPRDDRGKKLMLNWSITQVFACWFSVSMVSIEKQPRDDTGGGGGLCYARQHMTHISISAS